MKYPLVKFSQRRCPYRSSRLSENVYLPGCMLACVRKKDKQSRVLFMSHIAASIFDLFARVVV